MPNTAVQLRNVIMNDLLQGNKRGIDTLKEQLSVALFYFTLMAQADTCDNSKLFITLRGIGSAASDPLRRKNNTLYQPNYCSAKL
jgi:hypothetical protein